MQTGYIRFLFGLLLFGLATTLPLGLYGEASEAKAPDAAATTEKPQSSETEDCESYDHSISFPKNEIRILSKCHPSNARDKRPQRSVLDAITTGQYSLFVEASRIFSRFSDRNMSLDGLRLGMHQDGEQVISLAYYRNRDKPEVDALGRRYAASFEYGGLVLGGIGDVHDISDIYFGLLLGAGKLSLETDTNRYHSPSLLVLEPELGFNLQLSRWLQLSVALTYRWVSGFSEQSYQSRDLKDSNVAIRLRIGEFY